MIRFFLIDKFRTNFKHMKLLSFIIFLLTITLSSKSQKFNIGFKSGYAFPILQQMQGANDNNSLIYVSYGKGVVNNLSIEYLILPNLSIQSNTAYLIGDKQITDKQLGITEYKSEQFRSDINLRIYQHFTKFSYYSQLGMLIPFTSYFYRTLTRDEKTYFTFLKGYIMPAFTATTGVSRYVNNYLKLGIEIQIIAQRVRIKELTIDGKKITYPFNQTYELPFSSLSTQFNLNYSF